MNCPKCDGRLRVTHSFSGGNAGAAKRAWCVGCKRSFTLVLLLVAEDPGRGNGAYAVAKKMRNGKMKVGVRHQEPGEVTDPLTGAEAPCS